MKKVVLLLLSFLLIFSLDLFTPNYASAASGFVDIPSTHRAYKEISYLKQGNITTSDNPDLFAPDAPMTRAHAAAMIGKAVQLQGTPVNTRFPDVPADHFASGYIEDSVNRGIIFGYKQENGTYLYKPGQQLKRGEMALLISRAFGFQSDTTNAAAQEFMAKGISDGVGKGNFGTELPMKRGDFAVFLARAVNADFREKALQVAATPMYVNVSEDTSLNMRTGPSVDYTEKMKLFSGNPVDVLYTVGDWVYAKVDNITGFIHGYYLSTDQPAISNMKDPIHVTPTPVPGPVTSPISGKKPLNQLTIVIDPGHGGKDPGAAGNGLREKDIVLDISKRMKTYFQGTPINVKLTRETDVFLELSQRVQYAKQNKADLFISVHANAFNGKASGIESFYYSAARNPNVQQSKALSTYIQKRMLEAWNLPDRRVQSKSLYVIRENTMPATLIEVGFIDNAKDAQYIKSAAHRETMAKAVFLGTLDYLYHFEGRSEVSPLYSKYNATPSRKYH
ncbi:N-acetylmuramoyl-L-alanine amidase [Sporosarcina luteola]|uniref:N-acetylmuramoyl-L-alanine amidase n=1 Tax=Sporosarcina luteola TaxID=582850 RepID=UPI00203C4437|nr:N-acetylmuramoyl-L-alanine amidase [Sporosarcina luteola]MCM3744127.1 N-acetylmuramoyl-L-alanine amidase [Sporosarcina luteola]